MPMNPRLLRPLARLQALPPPPSVEDVATLVSTQSDGNIEIYGYSSAPSNCIRVEWWDSTVDFGFFWDSPASKAASGAGTKTIRVYPCNANGVVGGRLSSLSCGNNSLTSLDISGLTALADLQCANNSLTSLNLSNATALISLGCDNNSLTSLDISGLTALSALRCSDTSITSLRATGCAFAGWYSTSLFYTGGAIIRNNLLNATALNQFYTDLANGTGWIQVGGNPGTSGDDPTIATAKGYTVYGS